jgi:putative cardiolipin synthase
MSLLRWCGWLLTVTLAVAGSVGCASLPDRGRIEIPQSRAIVPSPETRLGATAQTAIVRSSSSSAFKLLPLSGAAYETRIELAKQAERSLDLQTFVLHGDASGGILLRSLRDAAVRGVRIRILVDDLHTDTAEALLSDLAAFERVEVRLVNPFVRLRGSRTAKLLSSLDDLSRVNHRMHNKVFIADNALAVFGGRNVGDEYFLRAEDGNFLDLDVLTAGDAVLRLSDSFDAYWNSEFAWPIDAVVAPRGSRAARRRNFDVATAPLALPPVPPPPERLFRFGTAPAELRSGVLMLVGADAEVVSDPVDKLEGTRVGERAGTVRAAVGDAGRAARYEVYVVSPYFIPGRVGIESLRLNRRNSVRLRLLTNSLAATDEPAVHAGYVAFRRELLELGMEIHELSPSLAREGLRLGRFAPSALHIKAIFFDRNRMFLGSMNLDGRSEQYNTEVGVMIRSAELTAELLSVLDFDWVSYRVELGPDGNTQWVGRRDGRVVVLDGEPEAGLMRRLTSRLLGLLLPDDWL